MLFMQCFYVPPTYALEIFPGKRVNRNCTAESGLFLGAEESEESACP